MSVHRVGMDTMYTHADEACADAAWGAGQKELRHTGIFLTEQMYTYDLTATEIKP